MSPNDLPEDREREEETLADSVEDEYEDDASSEIFEDEEQFDSEQFPDPEFAPQYYKAKPYVLGGTNAQANGTPFNIAPIRKSVRSQPAGCSWRPVPAIWSKPRQNL